MAVMAAVVVVEVVMLALLDCLLLQCDDKELSLSLLAKSRFIPV